MICEEIARNNAFEKRAISLDDNSRVNNSIELNDANDSEDVVDDNMTTETSLQSRFGRLLSCEDMADVHFVVGGAKGRKLRIPAHRLVLAVASPVFRELLFDNGVTEDIVLQDLEPIVFLEFLRFLYTDQIRLQKDNAVAILSAAKKYDIPALEQMCRHFVNYSIDKDNCLAIWLSAKTFGETEVAALALKTFGETEVAALALKVIRRFAGHVVLAPDFVRCDFASVCALLADDLLRAREVDLFVAVTRWTKSECLRRNLCPTRVNIRHVMSEAVNLIRFPLMSGENLKNVVQSEGVLEDDVLRALLCAQKTWPRKALHFSATPRAFQRLRGQILCVQRFQSFDNALPNPCAKRTLRFAVNKRIFVAGVGVYGPRRPQPFQLEIAVRIVRWERRHAPTIVDVAQQRVRVKCDSSEPIINVKFDEEFEIEANVEFEVSAEIEATERPSGARFHASRDLHFFYGIGGQLAAKVKTGKSSSRDLHFFYGIGGQLAAKVKTGNAENVIFNFAWDHVCDEGVASASAPPTPNPPPRPPPPQGYRRPSRFERLKRALSFTEKSELTSGSVSDVTCGQIPVILFFA
ncbi:unnamed protein product [Medioppia subpectinata]|uniref:BTB domain-containing protein n=1 Tax=Medioppia subpectinata TaxID=1979941 RepID=A0A7R9PTG3_9ACAR|nr:unnamed protein product [Medioppia subpectinata]CAG2100430.1 unnamed protein product [Medioppia subpectinata]